MMSWASRFKWKQSTQIMQAKSWMEFRAKSVPTASIVAQIRAASGNAKSAPMKIRSTTPTTTASVRMAINKREKVVSFNQKYYSFLMTALWSLALRIVYSTTTLNRSGEKDHKPSPSNPISSNCIIFGAQSAADTTGTEICAKFLLISAFCSYTTKVLCHVNFSKKS